MLLWVLKMLLEWDVRNYCLKMLMQSLKMWMRKMAFLRQKLYRSPVAWRRRDPWRGPPSAFCQVCAPLQPGHASRAA